MELEQGSRATLVASHTPTTGCDDRVVKDTLMGWSGVGDCSRPTTPEVVASLSAEVLARPRSPQTTLRLFTIFRRRPIIQNSYR